MLVLRVKDLCPALISSNLSELISEVIYRLGLVELGETGLDLSWGLVYHLLPVGLGQHHLLLLFLT